MDVITEAVCIDSSSATGLRWLERPMHHFSGKRAWSIAKRRNFGKDAGTLMRSKVSYYTVTIKQVRYLAHRVVYALHYGVDPGDMQIDHINGNGLDNRIENLRLATNSQNSMNRRMQKNNSSGMRGVFWNQRRKAWMAYIKINKKQKIIGYFKTIHEACCAYESEAAILFGEFKRKPAAQ